MARLLVIGTLPGDGASVVAAGLAAAVRASGASVRLARVGGDNRAADDARQFARLNGVRSSGEPAASLADVPDDADHTIIEAPASAERSADDRVVLVARHGEADDDTLSRAIADLEPVGVVLNGVPERGEETAAERVAALDAALIAALPQDRHLASPLVRDIAPAVNGALSGDAELFDEAARDLVVGPVSAHEGMDYFRKYPDKTVISRHDRIDIALGALDYEPLCLILSGGEPTLPYVAQRAERESFALITTPLSTVETVEAIGPLYGAAPFSGARKLSAAIDLIAPRLSAAALL